MQASVKRAAHEFGVHVRQGGWRLGLLVVCNVEKGKGHGGDRKSDQDRTRDLDPSGKVNATEFARLSGTSADRVLRYLTAWNNAADAGHVPNADTLTPGDENDTQLDVESLPDWSDFYPPQYADRMARAGKQAARERPEQVAEALRAAPEAAVVVIRALLEDDATRDVVISDPETASVVRRVANEAYARQHPVPEREVYSADPSQYELDHLLLRSARPLHEARQRVEHYGVRAMRSLTDARSTLDTIVDDVSVLVSAVNDQIESEVPSHES